MSWPDYDGNLDNYTWMADQVDAHEIPQAFELGKLLMQTLSPKSVIDLGCSSGIYLVPFWTQGIDIQGVDGASGVGRWIPGHFWVRDLRQTWDPPRRYDLALCIETGEHLRPEYHETLAETICKCSDTVFWSAAPPGQGGDGHYGERPKQEWIDLFRTHGFEIHPKNTEITEAINANEVYDHCRWLKNNAVVLVRPL